MEKQPVDDLFARKLREAEVPVSPDLFDQVQKRMGTKPVPVRRSLGGWWRIAGAACLLMAFSFLYMVNKTESHRPLPIAGKEVVQAGQNETVNAVVATTDSKAALERKRQTANTDDTTIGVQAHRVVAEVTYPVRKRSQASLPIVDKQRINAETEQFVITPQRIVEPVTETADTAPVERIARVISLQKQASERIIVLTIEEPLVALDQVKAKDEIALSNAQHSTHNGLSGLFGKLKQLKNGEVLAKAAPVNNQTNQKNRLGRVFSEVKESLKNETTLE